VRPPIDVPRRGRILALNIGQAGCPAGGLCGERHLSQGKVLFEMAARIIKAFPTL
jgi:hypothetical protein